MDDLWCHLFACHSYDHLVLQKPALGIIIEEVIERGNVIVVITNNNQKIIERNVPGFGKFKPGGSLGTTAAG